MIPVTGGSLAPANRQRERLVRSIAQSQLLTSAALLLLAIFALVVDTEAFVDPLFFGGLALVFVVTGAAVLVPWNEHNKPWAVLLPVADIVAIVCVGEGNPSLGTGLFLVFPVIWMARNFYLSGAVAGVTLSTGLLWVAWAARDEPASIEDFFGLVLLPLTLSFIATTIYVTNQRSIGQRVLLRQQAALTETAFSRARRQEQYLDEVLNTVEFGVLAYNREGVVTLVNESHRQSLVDFGAPRSAYVYPVVYQADRVTEFPEATRPFSRALAGQSFENLILWVGEPGSKRAAFSVTSRALTTHDGEPDGGVLVLRDVTAELDAIQARDDLVGSVSHELRTPLTSIIGYLELVLDDEDLTESTQKMIDIAHRNSERLMSLVTDLLQAASDADKSLTLNFEECDIAEIVQQAIDGQRPTASANRVELKGDIAGPILASADPLRIRQVIDNLLSNAIKYNRAGGSVTLAVTRSAESLSVSVDDTGVGLSEVERSQLFDRFYRTESARASQIHGSGLGMGITRDIVRQHGGDLTVTSTPGVGSSFVITLPAVRREQF